MPYKKDNIINKEALNTISWNEPSEYKRSYIASPSSTMQKQTIGTGIAAVLVDGSGYYWESGLIGSSGILGYRQNKNLVSLVEATSGGSGSSSPDIAF